MKLFCRIGILFILFYELNAVTQGNVTTGKPPVSVASTSHEETEETPDAWVEKPRFEIMQILSYILIVICICFIAYYIWNTYRETKRIHRVKRRKIDELRKDEDIRDHEKETEALITGTTISNDRMSTGSDVEEEEEEQGSSKGYQKLIDGESGDEEGIIHSPGYQKLKEPSCEVPTSSEPSESSTSSENLMNRMSTGVDKQKDSEVFDEKTIELLHKFDEIDGDFNGLWRNTVRDTVRIGRKSHPKKAKKEAETPQKAPKKPKIDWKPIDGRFKNRKPYNKFEMEKHEVAVRLKSASEREYELNNLSERTKYAPLPMVQKYDPAKWQVKNRLTIRPEIFDKLYNEMKFKPKLLEVMSSEERDPKKTLIHNWFDFCQPEFEIPPELIINSFGNPQLCRNSQVQAWDNTAYLVGKTKQFQHASMISLPGEGDIGRVLVCQAPFDGTEKGRKDTRPFFWQMVEETKSDFIIMACQHLEDGKVKCGRYFPDLEGKSEIYGEIEVKLLETREMYEEELMIRKFEWIRVGDKKEEHENPNKLMHFQFLKWKEGTIPESNMALEALKFVNSKTRRQLKPIICHSHLGTGRACIVAGLEYMCSMICNWSRASTQMFQVKFRTQRLGALQTGQQLYFVQVMAFDLLIRLFNFNSYIEIHRTEWDLLGQIFDVGGDYDKKAHAELDEYEKKVYRRTVPFKGTGKKKMILTVSAPVPYKALIEQKTQSIEDTAKDLSMKTVRGGTVMMNTVDNTTNTVNTTVNTTTMNTTNTTNTVVAEKTEAEKTADPKEEVEGKVEKKTKEEEEKVDGEPKGE